MKECIQMVAVLMGKKNMFGCNGKQIDFALRNPEQIQEIESYELPSDNDLREQEISSIFCESCYLRECCSKVFCLLSKGAKNE